MKLIYDLPEPLAREVECRLAGEPILFCVPSDVSLDGRFVAGFVVLSRTRLVVTDEVNVITDMSIASGSEYRATSLVHNGVLEARVDGEPTILARYSVSHAARYALIVKALSQLAEGQEPKVFSTPEDDTCPRCGRSYPEGSTVCPACLNKLAVLKRLFEIARPYWPLLALAVALLWAITGIHLVVPVIYRVLIDGYLRPGRHEPRTILLLVTAIGALNLCAAGISVVRNRLMVTTGGRLARDLRAMVFGKIQMLSLAYLDRRKTGDLMNRVSGD
ncbi:MAG: hypothetical protein GXX08_09660, partial [Firmicutes bacterium]|nr:hypothetical protein [Bacillota bacterium]